MNQKGDNSKRKPVRAEDKTKRFVRSKEETYTNADASER
jgi:hypothetical protein